MLIDLYDNRSQCNANADFVDQSHEKPMCLHHCVPYFRGPGLNRIPHVRLIPEPHINIQEELKK